MSKKIKWGILGFARIAKSSVIPAILKDENSVLYAVASRSKEKLDECEKLFSPQKLYSSYDDIINDEEIDAVYIPLPNSMHYQWTIKACEKGKHVLCEKPISLNSKECEEMIEIAKKNKVLLMEAFMYRYTDRTRKVLNVINSGKLGEIKYIYASFRFFLDRLNTIKDDLSLGGGSLYDVGCYPVNFTSLITRELPESVCAQATMKNGVDVQYTGVIKFPSGITADISCGFNAFPDMAAKIIGTNGLLEIPDTFSGDPGTITLKTKDHTEEIKINESQRYVLEVENFSKAILDKGGELFSLDITLRNMKILEQLADNIGLKF